MGCDPFVAHPSPSPSPSQHTPPVETVTKRGDGGPLRGVNPWTPMNTPHWTFVNDYHVEKLRLPVVLVTSDNERLSGDLFVQPNSRHHVGPEGASDILNGPESFVPIATLSGKVLLLAKSRIRELLVAREDVDPGEWELGSPVAVEIQLSGGARHSGVMTIERTNASQRLLDYLNRIGERFLSISTDDGVVLINRDHIVHVEQAS